MIVDIEVRDAGAKGLGVFALRSFRRGEFIFRRRHGRIVPNASIASLSADEHAHLCEIDFGRSAVFASSPSITASTLARERSARSSRAQDR